MLPNAFPHRTHPGTLLAGLHLQCKAQRPHDTVHVVRVDDECLLQFLRGDLAAVVELASRRLPHRIVRTTSQLARTASPGWRS